MIVVRCARFKLQLLLGLVLASGNWLAAQGQEHTRAEDFVKLDADFWTALTQQGQAYADTRDKIIKHKHAQAFLEWKMDEFKKRPDPEAQALCCYLSAWLKHGESYRRILEQVVDEQPFENTQRLSQLLFDAFSKEKASLVLLIEGIDKVGETKVRGGSPGASFFILSLMCTATPERWESPWTPAAIVPSPVPKELYLSAEEKAVLVRVANRVLLSGPPGTQAWWDTAFGRPGRASCARLLRSLASPSSVAAIVKAAIGEKDEAVLSCLRMALKACASTPEGKKALVSVKQEVDKFLPDVKEPSGTEGSK